MGPAGPDSHIDAVMEQPLRAGNTRLHVAAERGNLEECLGLLRGGAEVDARNDVGALCLL